VSWLVVFAVGLAPMIVYWLAGLIGRAFQSKRADCGTVSRPVGNEGEEPADGRDTARPG
jgi:hypothetical protein